MPKISIVSPCYNEEENVEELCRRVREVFESLPGYEYEHIFIDNASVDPKRTKGKRQDGDYAVSWCQEYGKGRSFYTSLGHKREVWKDSRFQEHLFSGIKWTLKLADGDATPSAKLKKE